MWILFGEYAFRWSKLLTSGILFGRSPTQAPMEQIRRFPHSFPSEALRLWRLPHLEAFWMACPDYFLNDGGVSYCSAAF
jgi:hypothetical protein